ncbi:MAG: tetratricopeptide repeat protein, partial [Abitibacteriaceae bacterium]|nr:tetratricopeptide repeat protein [Abditibacteriaceae bacterium]
MSHRGTVLVSSNHEGRALSIGDIVRTNATGQAHIVFSNGGRMTLGPSTNIQIVAAETKASPLMVRVFGTLSTVWVKPHGNTIINTRPVNAGARGTEFVLRLISEDTTEVTVTEGSVDFYNEYGQVLVNVDERSVAHFGQRPEPPHKVDVTGLVEWTAETSGLPVEFETPFTALGPAHLEVAKLQYESALNANPAAGNITTIHFHLGEIYYDSGAYSAATEQFAQVVRQEPQNTAAIMALGRSKWRQGNIPGAIEAYQQALKLSPTAPAPRIYLALAYLSQQEDPQDVQATQNTQQAAALAKARGILEPVRDDPMGRAVLGLIELHQGHTTQAKQQLLTATQQAPRLYQAKPLLALAYLTDNQLPQAITTAEEAVRLQPYSAQAQGTLGMVDFFGQRPKEASRAAKQAVQLDPLSPFALLTQGRILLANLEVDEARQAFQQAQALAPHLAIIPNELGAVYVRLDMLPKAEQSYRRAIELSPNFATAYAALGKVLYQRGRKSEAISVLQAALHLEPANSTALANLAELKIQEGDLKGAEQEINVGLKDASERGLLLMHLSEVNLLQQKIVAAQEAARQAVRVLPDSALAHYQLGRVYLEQGRVIQAQDEFRQAVILDSRCTPALFALGYTQQLVSTSPSYALPFPSNVAMLGGASSALNLQNLQTPGREYLVQAAIQDPD